MKKTYNVLSWNNPLKFLSVLFFFTLFFLGMTSSATAQLASSRAAAGNVGNVDLGLSQKAQINVSDEVALEILEQELYDARQAAQSNSSITPVKEAEFAARVTFLSKTLEAIKVKKSDVRSGLQMGHLALITHVANYSPQIKTLLDSEGIVREYVERLK